MPPRSPAPPGPPGPEDFRELAEQIAAAISEKMTLPVLLPQAKVWRYLGISRSAFFRLKGVTGFPNPVSVPGAGTHFRRSDLDDWAAKLKGKR